MARRSILVQRCRCLSPPHPFRTCLRTCGSNHRRWVPADGPFKNQDSGHETDSDPFTDDDAPVSIQSSAAHDDDEVAATGSPEELSFYSDVVGEAGDDGYGDATPQAGGGNVDGYGDATPQAGGGNVTSEAGDGNVTPQTADDGYGDVDAEAGEDLVADDRYGNVNVQDADDYRAVTPLYDDDSTFGVACDADS